MPIICGAIGNDGISLFRKVFISLPEKDILVVGYLEEGSNVSVSSLWESPFENETLGSIQGIEKGANILQARYNQTTVTLLNSLMTWQGQKPPALQLVVYFRALTDSYLEVQKPLEMLFTMQSPQLNTATPMGRRPYPVQVNIGRRMVFTDCIIQEVSHDLVAPKDSSGYFTYQTVNLTLSGMSVKNADEFSKVYV